jgi:FkbM family methyltransferase
LVTVLKRAVKGLAGLAGLRIIRKGALTASLGHSNAFVEQKRLSGPGPLTIFDVGAFNGEISRVYVTDFPTAQIYSFEPFPSSFEQLKVNMITYPNVHIYNIGLSDESGRQVFYSNTFAQTNSLLEPDAAAAETWPTLYGRMQRVECEFTTLDEFMEEQKISNVDILKIDVQGAETRVLNGGRNAFSAGRIALIYSEIITRPTYKGQKKLWEILKTFDECGMDLHNIYNFHFEPHSGRLQQVDAIFVRRSRAQA